MQFDGLGDRAIVYIDDKKVGVVERGLEEKPIYFSTGETPVKIGFLVENMGRTNFGPNLIDKKGLAGVRLRWEYVNRNLTGFESLPLPMDNLEKLKFSPIWDAPNGEPTFYRGEFEVDEVADTFIKPSGFTKGLILINGVNIGRYYNPAGPQKTLYVPACWLKKGKNEIVLLETDGVESLTAEFVDTPEL